MKKENYTEVRMRDQISQLEKLSTSFPIAEQALKCIDNSDVSVSELIRWISADPVLAARILKLANSAYYGYRGQISTLNHAIVIIGFKALQNLLMGILVVDQLSWNAHFDQPEFNNWWIHSTAVGIGARYLARRAGYPVPGEAFAAGLLHDIGHQILIQHFPEKFREILSLVSKRNMPYQVAEKKILGYDHTRVGGWLAEAWNLPHKLVNVIYSHHESDKLSEINDLVNLVRMSELICSTMKINNTPVEFETRFTEKEILKKLNDQYSINGHPLKHFQEKIREEWEKYYQSEEITAFSKVYF